MALSGFGIQDVGAGSILGEDYASLSGVENADDEDDLARMSVAGIGAVLREAVSTDKRYKTRHGIVSCSCCCRKFCYFFFVALSAIVIASTISVREFMFLHSSDQDYYFDDLTHYSNFLVWGDSGTSDILTNWTSSAQRELYGDQLSSTEGWENLCGYTEMSKFVTGKGTDEDHCSYSHPQSFLPGCAVGFYQPYRAGMVYSNDDAPKPCPEGFFCPKDFKCTVACVPGSQCHGSAFKSNGKCEYPHSMEGAKAQDPLPVAVIKPAPTPAPTSAFRATAAPSANPTNSNASAHTVPSSVKVPAVVSQDTKDACLGLLGPAQGAHAMLQLATAAAEEDASAGGGGGVGYSSFLGLDNERYAKVLRRRFATASAAVGEHLGNGGTGAVAGGAPREVLDVLLCPGAGYMYLCAGGRYCPTAVTSIACTAGHYCPVGSIGMRHCGLANCRRNESYPDYREELFYYMMLIVLCLVIGQKIFRELRDHFRQKRLNRRKARLAAHKLHKSTIPIVPDDEDEDDADDDYDDGVDSAYGEDEATGGASSQAAAEGKRGGPLDDNLSVNAAASLPSLRDKHATRLDLEFVGLGLVLRSNGVKVLNGVTGRCRPGRVTAIMVRKGRGVEGGGGAGRVSAFVFLFFFFPAPACCCLGLCV